MAATASPLQQKLYLNLRMTERDQVLGKQCMYCIDDVVTITEDIFDSTRYPPFGNYPLFFHVHEYKT